MTDDRNRGGCTTRGVSAARRFKSATRRNTIMSHAVGHLDSGFTVLLKEIRAAVEVCEHAAHGSLLPKQNRATGAAVCHRGRLYPTWRQGQVACAGPWLRAARACVHF